MEGSFIPLSAGPANLRQSTSASAGFWINGGARTFQSANVGDTLNLQVRLWDINFGATFEAARANPAYRSSIGVSALFLFTVVANTDAANQRMFNFQGFSLTFVPVPEPSMFALAGLGAAALVIFRRRK